MRKRVFAILKPSKKPKDWIEFGCHPKGVFRFIRAIAYDYEATPNENDLERLIVETQFILYYEWVGYSAGLTKALAVFTKLCRGYSDSAIAKQLRISPTQVWVIREKLTKLRAIKRFKRKLKVLNRVT